MWTISKHSDTEPNHFSILVPYHHVTGLTPPESTTSTPSQTSSSERADAADADVSEPVDSASTEQNVDISIVSGHKKGRVLVVDSYLFAKNKDYKGNRRYVIQTE